MIVQPVPYEPIPEGEEPGRCYVCFPPHDAEYRSGPRGTLRLCENVLRRLIKEGRATCAALTEGPGR